MSPLTIPIGPHHPALKEPVSLLLEVTGEEVVGVSLRIGYVHRGIEQLCEQRTYLQNVHVLERVCGICSHAHTTAYCQAVEALLGIELPRRAAYIRVLLCELERIHSHLLWLGVLAEAVGFTTIFMYAWRDRELVLDLMEELSGGRVSHAVNVVGGVRIDVDGPALRRCREQLAAIEGQLELFRDLVEHDRTLQLRIRGLGHLSLETVRALSIVGPTARASGLDLDLRRDAPYAAYEELDLQVITAQEGDVWCRAVVRVEEIMQSLRLCRQIVDGLPATPVSVKVPRRVPAGEVVARTEAPRGELFYYLRSDGSDRPARVKIRTPSLPGLMSLLYLLPGLQMADVVAVKAGADLCISCADR
jgi:NADH-quinone oxidoreductase subunit D